MGDDADFVEWNALFSMYTRVQGRLTLLQGYLGDCSAGDAVSSSDAPPYSGHSLQQRF